MNYEITPKGRATIEGRNIENIMLAFAWLEDRKNWGRGIGLRLAGHLGVANSTAYKYMRRYLKVKRELAA